MSGELSFSFSLKKEYIRFKFTETFKFSMALNYTVFEACNIDTNSLIACAKT
jgi:hypothetical protein